MSSELDEPCLAMRGTLNPVFKLLGYPNKKAKLGSISCVPNRVASLAFFVPNSSNLAFFERGWHANFAFGIFFVSGIFWLFIKLNFIYLQSFRLLSKLSHVDNAATSRGLTLYHSHNAGRHVHYVGATTTSHHV